MIVQAYNANFLLVGGNNLVDVERKIVVMEGRLDMNANGVQSFHVYYDPEIRKDRLTMTHREAPHYVKTRFPVPNFNPDAETIFYSTKREKLFEFYFGWGQRANGRLPMVLSFQRALSRVMDTLSPHTGADTRGYLAEIVTGAFDIYDVQSGTSNVGELALFARRDIAEALYRHQAAVETGDPVLLFSKQLS